MVTWEDLDRIARALPAVDAGTSYGSRAWTVGDKSVAELGEAAPDGPVLAFRSRTRG